MKIYIIKQFRLLEVGKQLDIDREYAANLIEKGYAKSLEVVKEVEEAKKEKEIPVEKPKKEKSIKEK